MRASTLVSIAASCAIGLVATEAACAGPRARETAATPGEPSLVQRGEYLVHLGGCNDCHTPWRFDPGGGCTGAGHEPDAIRSSGKQPIPTASYTAPDMAVIGPTFTSFALPFGIIYAPNLTPDAATGLGTWTPEKFIGAMRTGYHLGQRAGRPILPPMPWFDVAGLTDDDLRAVFAYLESIPPVRNELRFQGPARGGEEPREVDGEDENDPTSSPSDFRPRCVYHR